jgi:hypothetical protein
MLTKQSGALELTASQSSPTMPSEGLDHFTPLPVDILRCILDYIGLEQLTEPDYCFFMKRAIFSTSLVSKKLRDLCLPLMFRSLEIAFGEPGFEKLRLISSSPHLAPLVRDLHYVVPRLFKTGEDLLLSTILRPIMALA